MKKSLIAAALLAITGSAFAANNSFESGFSGWTGIGARNISTSETAADGSVYTATDGNKFAVLNSNSGKSMSKYGGTDGTRITANVTVNAGEQLKFDWAFLAGDYMPYNDFGLFSINGQNFTLSNVAAVGNYGDTGWNTFSWVANTPFSGLATFVVANVGDQALNSRLLVDNLRVVPVPEPETYALMGLGAVALFLRRRKTA